MDIVDQLIKDLKLKSPSLIAAFRKIRRADFLLPASFGEADLDVPLAIGEGQTNSQPTTVAFMLELLDPKPGEWILDVGSGSGWTAALLAEAMGESGRVYGLEVREPIRAWGETNAEKYQLVTSGRIRFLQGDGHLGLPALAPFDKILVSAATPTIPVELTDQLKLGGRLVLPIGEWYEAQSIVVVDKISEHKFREQRFPGFVFVPLVGKS